MQWKCLRFCVTLRGRNLYFGIYACTHAHMHTHLHTHTQRDIARRHTCFIMTKFNSQNYKSHIIHFLFRCVCVCMCVRACVCVCVCVCVCKDLLRCVVGFLVWSIIIDVNIFILWHLSNAKIIVKNGLIVSLYNTLNNTQ